MALYDLEGRILEANAGFLKLFGYEFAALRGESHARLMRPDEAAGGDYQRLWRELAKGWTQQGTFQRLRGDGAVIEVVESFEPIAGACSAPTRVIGVAAPSLQDGDIDPERLAAFECEGAAAAA